MPPNHPWLNSLTTRDVSRIPTALLTASAATFPASNAENTVRKSYKSRTQVAQRGKAKNRTSHTLRHSWLLTCCLATAYQSMTISRRWQVGSQTIPAAPGRPPWWRRRLPPRPSTRYVPTRTSISSRNPGQRSGIRHQSGRFPSSYHFRPGALTATRLPWATRSHPSYRKSPTMTSQI